MKILNSNIEIRNRYEILNDKSQTQSNGKFGNLEYRYYLELRVSHLGFEATARRG